MPVPQEADRLPPGQVATRKFPVTGEKEPSVELTASNYELLVEGELERDLRFTLDDLLSWPQRELTTDIHCVTRWSRRGARWTGIRFAELCEHGMAPAERARFVRYTAYSSRNHDTSLPLDVALAEAWLVHSVDGEPLTRSHGFPLRLLMPNRYFYKSLKWLHRITLLQHDQLGFWERTSGYHNHGDPWKEERFEGERFTSTEEVDAFRRLKDFSAYRAGGGKILLKADFRAWRPKTRDLRGLQLKACDFREARLSGVDFREANLTLGRFEGADLNGADFTGADLEGADFTGARLADSRFHANQLSSATFIQMSPSGARRGLAEWEGMEVKAPEGLLEAQTEYLRSLGVLVE